jgi:hypothetical protein
MTNLKIISLAVAIKRKRKNSIVLKKANYILAKEYNLSPNTFAKYFNELNSLGFLEDQGNCYRVASLSKIISFYFKDSDIFFGQHRILRGKSTNPKEIETELRQLLVVDNIIKPQQRQIENKRLIKLFIDSLGTDKQAKSEWFSLPYKVRKKTMRMYSKSVRNKEAKNKFNDQIVTSVRHTAIKVGVTKYMASKTLKSNDMYTRKIEEKWYNGCSFLLIERLKVQYPDCLIIPYPHFNKVKVCFGSRLTPTC